MKGKRFKLFILSVVLVTICSGVLFYKNLFTLEPPRNALKVDFDELRTVDLQVNNTVYFLRQNLTADMDELEQEITRIKELVDILKDIKRNSPELRDSVLKIDEYFKIKDEKLMRFKKALLNMRSNITNLSSAYANLVKNNIKFTVEKRDFYRDCLLNIYQFLAFAHRDNELRVIEDQKIIGQVINFSSAPNAHIVKFAAVLESIHKDAKTIDDILLSLKEDTINPEMITVSKYYQESVEVKNRQNENFLKIIFVAIALYLIAMVFILRS